MIISKKRRFSSVTYFPVRKKNVREKEIEGNCETVSHRLSSQINDSGSGARNERCNEDERELHADAVTEVTSLKTNEGC